MGIAELRGQVGRLSEEVTRLHGEHAQAVEGLTHHVDAHQRAEQVEQQVATDADRLRSQADAAEVLWQSAELHARALDQAVRDAQARIVALRGDKQETLRRSDRRFRSLVENLDDIVFSLDADGRLCYISPAIRRFGYDPVALVGTPLCGLVQP